MSFELAQRVADAVLYEGYVLYPYRASAAKNRFRWQFGVVAPRSYAEAGRTEPWAMQTECLIEPLGGPLGGPLGAPVLDLRVRFLQTESRLVETRDGDGFRPVDRLVVDGREVVTWDEGLARQVDESGIAVDDLLGAERTVAIAVPGNRAVEMLHDGSGTVCGRIVRESWPVSALLRVSAERVGSLIRVRARIENTGAWPGARDGSADRAVALRTSLLGAHLLLSVGEGAFISLLDPPADAKAAAAACTNLHTWPVLVGPEGDRSVMLSSPIILYDYPAIAAESPGDLFDATEIDEILTLRVMTLTEDEKREARATDDRARQIIERSDAIPAEVFERLHGAWRSVPGESHGSDGHAPPSWDIFAGPAGADPGDDSVDVEDATYIAVTVEDDPAGDLHAWYGRYYYFHPEELEPADSRPHPDPTTAPSFHHEPRT